MEKLLQAVRYLNVGLVPNISVMLGLSSAAAGLAQNNELAALSGFAGAAIGIREGIRQFYNYNRIKDLLTKYDFNERIVNKTSNTWCGRHSTKLAAKHTGNLDNYLTYLECSR